MILANCDYLVKQIDDSLDKDILKHLEQIGIREGSILRVLDNHKYKFVLEVDETKYVVSKKVLEKFLLERIENEIKV